MPACKCNSFLSPQKSEGPKDRFRVNNAPFCIHIREKRGKFITIRTHTSAETFLCVLWLNMSGDGVVFVMEMCRGLSPWATTAVVSTCSQKVYMHWVAMMINTRIHTECRTPAGFSASRQSARTRGLNGLRDAAGYCRNDFTCPPLFFVLEMLVSLKSQKMPNHTDTWSRQTTNLDSTQPEKRHSLKTMHSTNSQLWHALRAIEVFLTSIMYAQMASHWAIPGKQPSYLLGDSREGGSVKNIFEPWTRNTPHCSRRQTCCFLQWGNWIPWPIFSFHSQLRSKERNEKLGQAI